MQNVLNPLISMYQSQLDVSRKCADAVFSGTEKIDRMLIGATHRVFTEQLNFAQAITTVRDPKSIGNVLQSGFMPRTPDEAVNYQREIIRIFSDMQNEIGRSFQEYVEQIGGQAAHTATRPLEATQERTNDAVFNPMTSMFSVWESAFKDVAALAKKNMTVARSSVDDVASMARQTSTNYADVTAAGTQQAAESAAGAAKSAMVIGEEAGTDEKRGPQPSGGTKRK